MEAYNIKDVDSWVDAAKAHAISRAKVVYGSVVENPTVDESVTMQQLLLIADATNQPIEVGSRNPDGSAQTKHVVWNGCNFWAPVFKAAW